MRKLLSTTCVLLSFYGGWNIVSAHKPGEGGAEDPAAAQPLSPSRASVAPTVARGGEDAAEIASPASRSTQRRQQLGSMQCVSEVRNGMLNIRFLSVGQEATGGDEGDEDTLQQGSSLTSLGFLGIGASHQDGAFSWPLSFPDRLLARAAAMEVQEAQERQQGAAAIEGVASTHNQTYGTRDGTGRHDFRQRRPPRLNIPSLRSVPSRHLNSPPAPCSSPIRADGAGAGALSDHLGDDGLDRADGIATLYVRVLPEPARNALEFALANGEVYGLTRAAAIEMHVTLGERIRQVTNWSILLEEYDEYTPENPLRPLGAYMRSLITTLLSTPESGAFDMPADQLQRRFREGEETGRFQELRPEELESMRAWVAEQQFSTGS